MKWPLGVHVYHKVFLKQTNVVFSEFGKNVRNDIIWFPICPLSLSHNALHSELHITVVNHEVTCHCMFTLGLIPVFINWHVNSVCQIFLRRSKQHILTVCILSVSLQRSSVGRDVRRSVLQPADAAVCQEQTVRLRLRRYSQPPPLHLHQFNPLRVLTGVWMLDAASYLIPDCVFQQCF